MTVHSSWMIPKGRARDREDAGVHLLDSLVVTIESLEAQLNSIYEERSSGDDLSAESAMESMEAQLRDLYAEREAQEAEGSLARSSAAEAHQMVESLLEQVAALLEERNALSDTLENTRMEIKTHREKASSLMAALVDRALA